MGGSGSFSGPSGSEEGFPGPGSSEGSPDTTSGEMPSGGTNSSAYHMASFDYAYNCVAVTEWLFQQSK